MTLNEFDSIYDNAPISEEDVAREAQLAQEKQSERDFILALAYGFAVA